MTSSSPFFSFRRRRKKFCPLILLSLKKRNFLASSFSSSSSSNNICPHSTTSKTMGQEREVLLPSFPTELSSWSPSPLNIFPFCFSHKKEYALAKMLRFHEVDLCFRTNESLHSRCLLIYPAAFLSLTLLGIAFFFSRCQSRDEEHLAAKNNDNNNTGKGANTTHPETTFFPFPFP